MNPNETPYTPDRRQDVNAALMHLIEELTAQVHEMREEFKTHREALEVEQVALRARLHMESFPGGDPEAHRKYHERLIKADEERIAFWKRMREELVKWGLIGFIGWLVVFAGHAFWLEVLHQVAKKP
jgi:hypothetical protein